MSSISSSRQLPWQPSQKLVAATLDLFYIRLWSSVLFFFLYRFLGINIETFGVFFFRSHANISSVDSRTSVNQYNTSCLLKALTEATARSTLIDNRPWVLYA